MVYGIKRGNKNENEIKSSELQTITFRYQQYYNIMMVLFKNNK